ncbi:MAG: Nif3-like dinuclear metal center hexameric protein [Humidesulfovibrio sp.]|uniref:Nif3-like dinuclear metal center hexameric protein n=1 Tax=Humidesulfovibrio sp. TaxID=2910988 RepID=UPI0027F53F24|nr:Nif3-like dinuclear metal center hexameric protein [Humidesulfovibrio sp.]MDQ7835396.1 Nif3-like dinuclear metal center hexameric protein [Humidesulfovibrio sp.]
MNADKVLSTIRSLAPEAFAADWDNSRVQIKGERPEIKKLAVTLDPHPANMAQALAWGADLVITHHPLYFKAQAPTQDGQHLTVLRQFMKAGAWLYTAHTSLDCRPDGPAFWLGRALKLSDCASIEPVQSFPAREVFFQAPARITEREARPLSDAPGVIAVSQSSAGEVRVICEERAWDDIAERLVGIFGKRPEFLVRRLEAPLERVGFGQLGSLPKPLPYEDFAKLLEKALFSVQRPSGVIGGSAKGLAWAECGPRPEMIRRVGYTTGSGASLIPAAFAAGADVFICGDVKHHPAMETPGLVFDVGHFILEEEMMRLFAGELGAALSGVDVKFFEGKSPFGYRVLA